MVFLQLLNNPPAYAGDQPGRFPKTSKTLTHLEKQLPETEGQAGDNISEQTEGKKKSIAVI